MAVQVDDVVNARLRAFLGWLPLLFVFVRQPPVEPAADDSAARAVHHNQI